MKIRDDYTCPLEIVHDIIKGKWKTIILYQMKDGPKGLSELEHEIEGITQKMLLEQLRELIQFGLVEKKMFEGYPLHVEYSHNQLCVWHNCDLTSPADGAACGRKDV